MIWFALALVAVLSGATASVAGFGTGSLLTPPRGTAVRGLGLAWGVFGGVAGNQGGLRSGALLAFGLAPCTFVATSAATGLLVDAARLPVYLWQARSELWALPRLPLWIGLATAGVHAGTLVGERVLFGLSPERFRRLIAAAIGALGLWLLVSAA